MIWEGYCEKGLKPKQTDIQYYNVLEKPFRIYGLSNPQKNFHRLPWSVCEKAPAIGAHAICPAGGRIRFATDSPYVTVRVEHTAYGGSPHISRTASTGFDLYVEKAGKDVYISTYYPWMDNNTGYESVIEFRSKEMREITLNMPLSVEVNKIEIGLQEGSAVKEHRPYAHEKPIVFYGSSITNGFAASRPGMPYEAQISRMLDTDFRNMGFSGSCKGELPLAEYFGTLEMSAFVFDYDHNAPSPEYLQETHEPFFKRFRELQPETPVIMVSRPDYRMGDDEQKRRMIIAKTFVNARENGDKNVYFVDGGSFFPSDARTECTADGCHPNDLGMYFMAKGIGSVLKEVLNY